MGTGIAGALRSAPRSVQPGWFGAVGPAGGRPEQDFSFESVWMGHAHRVWAAKVEKPRTTFQNRSECGRLRGETASSKGITTSNKKLLISFLLLVVMLLLLVAMHLLLQKPFNDPGFQPDSEC